MLFSYFFIFLSLFFFVKFKIVMSVSELKERHVAAIETVNSLREQLKQKRRLLLDTDSNYYFISLPFLFLLGKKI